MAATEYFRVNPHRLNLGTIGLEMLDGENRQVQLKNLTNIHQELKLYDGVIESTFHADGEQVDVTTIGLQDKDAVAYRIKSRLLKDGRAKVAIRLP